MCLEETFVCLDTTQIVSPYVDQATRPSMLLKASRTPRAALDAALVERDRLQAAVKQLQEQIAAEKALLGQALNLLGQALPRVAQLHQVNLQLQERLATTEHTDQRLQNPQQYTGESLCCSSHLLNMGATGPRASCS